MTALAEGSGGFRHPTGDIARHLQALARRPDFPLGASTRDRHPDLAAALLRALSDAADPEQAARLLGQFFSRLMTPSVYAKAMAEDTHVLRRIVGLFGASAFLGEALVYRPELMESIVFQKIPPTPAIARSDVDDEVKAADPDLDAFVGALRHAKARVTMEVGLAELVGEIRAPHSTPVLTLLADASLEHATMSALAERGLDGGLAVIAMGKLGGREIGYGSDLDIFFVYEARHETPLSGGRGSAEGGTRDELAEKYIRAAQRVLSLVSTPHGQGPGYELDTRLRPSGSQGLLVVSLEAFERYHQEQGQAWERQALIKARPCAGDAELGKKVLAVATRVAYESGPPDADTIHRLRMRMEKELAKEGPRRYDVKLGKGGLVDVEFAVQWLQMKHGADPRVRTSDTETAIGALEACGYLDTSLAAVLREGYALLRRIEQALRVVHGTSASLIEEGAPGLPALARRMGFRAAERVTASEALLERYRAVTRDIRAAYLAVLGITRTAKDPL
jgi:glutamate-ammonia-ligase adenylyltransferase